MQISSVFVPKLLIGIAVLYKAVIYKSVMEFFPYRKPCKEINHIRLVEDKGSMNKDLLWDYSTQGDGNCKDPIIVACI